MVTRMRITTDFHKNLSKQDHIKGTFLSTEKRKEGILTQNSNPVKYHLRSDKHFLRHTNET